MENSMNNAVETIKTTDLLIPQNLLKFSKQRDIFGKAWDEIDLIEGVIETVDLVKHGQTATDQIERVENNPNGRAVPLNVYLEDDDYIVQDGNHWLACVRFGAYVNETISAEIKLTCKLINKPNDAYDEVKYRNDINRSIPATARDVVRDLIALLTGSKKSADAIFRALPRSHAHTRGAVYSALQGLAKLNDIDFPNVKGNDRFICWNVAFQRPANLRKALNGDKLAIASIAGIFIKKLGETVKKREADKLAKQSNTPTDRVSVEDISTNDTSVDNASSSLSDAPTISDIGGNHLQDTPTPTPTGTDATSSIPVDNWLKAVSELSRDGYGPVDIVKIIRALSGLDLKKLPENEMEFLVGQIMGD